ncbi:MAG: hypothetical protein WC777_03675 [Candidatus Gracilibacteria bacterium]|jgi:hypothetical protein
MAIPRSGDLLTTEELETQKAAADMAVIEAREVPHIAFLLHQLDAFIGSEVQAGRVRAEGGIFSLNRTKEGWELSDQVFRANLPFEVTDPFDFRNLCLGLIAGRIHAVEEYLRPLGWQASLSKGSESHGSDGEGPPRGPERRGGTSGEDTLTLTPLEQKDPVEQGASSTMEDLVGVLGEGQSH